MIVKNDQSKTKHIELPIVIIVPIFALKHEQYNQFTYFKRNL